MLLCHHPHQSPESSVIPFLALCVSVLTFILGVFAYQKFLAKQFREKQLEVVCDLINKINDEYNWFQFQSKVSVIPSFPICNIFDIAELPDIREEGNIYTFSEENESRHPGRINDKTKYQKFNEIVFWDFIRFHNNPLMPKSIASVLKKFNISNKSISGNKKYGEVKMEESWVIIGRKINVDDESPCHYYNSIRTWKDYVKLCKELKRVILKWAEDNGIEDMNISHSHNFNPNKI